MVNQPQVPSISVPRVLGLQMCVVTLAGDLNSGSHACMASTFPRSHLPTPLSAVFPTAEGQHRAGESKAVSIHYTLHVELERQASVQNRRKHQSWSWGLEGTEGEGPLEGRHCIYN